MSDTKDKEIISTRPYLIRALYEWCTENGFTPFVAVQVDDTVRVPMEYVKDGEIVLNVSFDATSALKLGNDCIEFKGRFGGVARDIVIPVERVLAIYARENGQGMAFPVLPPGAPLLGGRVRQDEKLPTLASAQSTSETEDSFDPPRPPHTNGGRPSLTRIK